MNSICIISYYGSIETIGMAKTHLEKENFIVYDFPLFKYIHDTCDKIPNYLNLLINFIKDNNINYILWWFINIPTNEFIEIKQNTSAKFLFFNWDEPYNWSHCDIINKMPYFDAVFVTCQETLEIYKKNGCHNAYCLYPGFDTSHNYLISNIDINDYQEYFCDISFCCTNLYEDEKLYPHQYIVRKKIVDDIYNGQIKHGYKFHLYGPENLKEKYHLSYKGFANFSNLNKIFNYSKINLCTHVINNKYGYLNERVILIGGSGGLLLVDYVNGIEDIFDINKEIIVLDKHYYINQIVDIINNYDDFINVRKLFNKKCIEKYSYVSWAKNISTIINKLGC